MESYIENNARAWDHEVESGNFWTVCATPEAVQKARDGMIEIWVTPQRNIPQSWLGDVKGRRILGLGAGGGQQCPILAAAGAVVTVFDNSPAQLEQDRKTAEREGLDMEYIRGDMRDLSVFDDASFDMVINPQSSCFIDDLELMQKEVSRVLVDGGIFITGFANPVMYCFDRKKLKKGRLQIKYTIPYSDRDSLSEKEYESMVRNHDTTEWSHDLDSQFGGLCRNGLVITDVFSDGALFEPFDSFIKDCWFAVRTKKINFKKYID